MNIEDVRIAVKVNPRSSRNEITGFIDDMLQVKIAAPPVGGRANKELISYLSKIFAVRKSDIVIEKGLTAKRKIIRIAGLDRSMIDKTLSGIQVLRTQY